MDREEPKHRLHDPDIKELVSELDGFKEVMNERDRRYQERYEAQKEAITKAEISQTQYNVQHNDLIRKGEAKDKEYLNVDRFEDFKKEYSARHQLLINDINELKGYRHKEEGQNAVARLDSLTNEITKLRLSGSETVGHSKGVSATWAVIISLLSLLGGGGIVAVIINALSKGTP